jgi:hypothetical protein
MKICFNFAIYTGHKFESRMFEKRATKIFAVVSLLAVFAGVGAVAAPAIAWAPCAITLSPSTQTTSVGVGQTIALTFLLTYNDAPYPATFNVHASVSSGSPSGTWSVVSVTPPNPVPSTTSGSISQTITVTVQAPSSPVGSTTTLTVNAVNNYDSGSKCSTSATLTTTALSGVPEFPVGMVAVLMATFPALLLVRSRFASKFP